VPLTWDGLKACKALSGRGRMVNVTLCFSANQALLAAKAGATFISPFIGRLDDIGLDGMELIPRSAQIYDNYGFPTEILAASIRTPTMSEVSAARCSIGADVRSPRRRPSIEARLTTLRNHPLTDKGLRGAASTGSRTPIATGPRPA
jgi:transaldolase